MELAAKWRVLDGPDPGSAQSDQTVWQRARDGDGSRRDLVCDSNRETVCLVGESGCGKSTTGRMVAGLLEATAGEVLFEGKNIRQLDSNAYRRYRQTVQIIHQDPILL
jgi:ABC-type transport system involved in cytochrome bd biosynthesis fused ATPase/permease subunit